MAIELNKFVKGKHLKPADFNLDDPTNLVSVKTDAASAVGTAIAAATPDTAKTVRGLVNLTDLQQMGDGRKVFDAGVHVGNGNPAFAGRATVTAIGQNAGANNTGSNQTASGFSAGQNNTGVYQTASGAIAGQNNTGVYQTASGAGAGHNNTGDNQTASGVNAGYNNTGDNQTASGYAAGYSNTGVYQTSSGAFAGQYNGGDNATFYGYASGNSTGGALASGVTITPTSATAGTVSPALPASVVGNSYPVTYPGSTRVFTFTSTTEYTTNGGPTTTQTNATVYNGLQFDNVTVLGANAQPTASNQVTLGDTNVTEVITDGVYKGDGYVDRSLVSAPFVKTDATGRLVAGSAASATVSGITRFATNEETRLGATDANKTTTAVTPDDMSYTLQTGKDYKLKLVGASSATEGMASFYNTGTSGLVNVAVQAIGVAGSHTSGTQVNRVLMLAGTGTGSMKATYSSVSSGVSTTADTTGVHGQTVGAGADNRGVWGEASGVGGINYGVYGIAANGTTNWAGFFQGNVSATSYITASDATLKENVEAIDSAKALAFRNGLQWKRYEMFSEEQVEIMEEVEVDGETTQKPTGRYEVKRHSQGRKYGLIAQDVQALTAQIGDFQDVVIKIGEYFDLDANGYPKKDAKGNVIKKDRFGLDYDAIQVVILAGEQAAFSPAGRNK